MASEQTLFEKSAKWIDTLRSLMEISGFNPRSLSLKAGLGSTAVRDMLEGRAKFPRYDTIAALAQALNVTPARLMGEDEALPLPCAKEEGVSDDDLDLLVDIVARLQETITSRRQNVHASDFAAMTASLYRQMKTTEKPKRRAFSDDAVLTQHVDHLVSYEDLRHRSRSRRQTK